MKLISLITLAIRGTLIFSNFFSLLLFFAGIEREEKTRVRPDKVRAENRTYFIYNIYRKFYSRCVAIYMCILLIWKPKLLLCLIGVRFGGRGGVGILSETEIRALHR